MTETEELKSAFEWCATMPGCKACPLENKYACRYRIMQWAYKRMNAQEKAIANLKEKLKPRVMKFEELRIDSDESVVCWVESASESAVHVTAPYRSMPHICLPFLGTEKITFAVERNYGKKWRCWNIRPSDEQRQNTPWEGENAIPVNPPHDWWNDDWWKNPILHPVVTWCNNEATTITGVKSITDATLHAEWTNADALMSTGITEAKYDGL